MKYIELKNGVTVKVCDCHYHLVSGYKWYFKKDYAMRNVWIDGKSKTIVMHRVINNTPAGLDTDHINRDKLDNTCDNLRSTTHKENMNNLGLRKNNTSGHIGIRKDKRYSTWRAYFRERYIGSYKTIEEAVAAREKVQRAARFI